MLNNKVKMFVLLLMVVAGGIPTASAYTDAGTYFVCTSSADCTNAVLDVGHTRTMLGNDVTLSGTFLNDPNVAANYVFDIGGHIIRGDGTGYGWKRQGSGSKTNITLTNGTIDRFNTGAYWQVASGGINNVTFINNSVGLQLYFGSAAGGIFKNNTYLNNGIGIEISNADSTRKYIINDSRFDNSTNFHIEDSSGGVDYIINNSFNGSSYPINIHAKANNSIISDNTFTECGSRCIDIEGAGDIHIENNSIKNIYNSPYTMYLVGDSNITIKNNTINGTYARGVGLMSSNNNISVIYNTFLNFSADHTIFLMTTNNSNISYNNITLANPTTQSIGGIDLDNNVNTVISYNNLTAFTSKNIALEVSDGVHNVSIFNNTVTGFYYAGATVWDGPGHDFGVSSNSSFFNNTFINSNTGIEINNSDNNRIYNNTYINIPTPINIQLSGTNTHIYNLTDTDIYMINPNAMNIGFGGSSFESVFNTSGSGTFILNVSVWNIASNYHKVWNENSTNHSATTQHTIGDFPANARLSIKVDGVQSATPTTNGTGYITFTYTGGYSSHVFDISIIALETLDTNWCEPYESSPYGALQFGTILTFVVGAALLFYGFREANFTLMIAGVAVIVGSIIALSIGAAIISRMLICQ